MKLTNLRRIASLSNAEANTMTAKVITAGIGDKRNGKGLFAQQQFVMLNV
jgi:hypothetical protein